MNFILITHIKTEQKKTGTEKTGDRQVCLEKLFCYGGKWTGKHGKIIKTDGFLRLSEGE